MKTIKQISVIAIAIITLGIIAGITACNNDNPAGEQPKVQPDTPRTLSFGTEENPCTVTIKSDDQFTTAEWTTLCDKVVGAIERGYNKDMGGALQNAQNALAFNIFVDNVSVVLLKFTTYDCEIKEGNYRKIYLKTNTLDTVDIQPAVKALSDETAYHHPEPVEKHCKNTKT